MLDANTPAADLHHRPRRSGSLEDGDANEGEGVEVGRLGVQNGRSHGGPAVEAPSEAVVLGKVLQTSLDFGFVEAQVAGMDERTLHPALVHEVWAIQDLAKRGGEDGSVPVTNIDLVAGVIVAGSGSSMGEEAGILTLDQLLREEDVDCVAPAREGLLEGVIVEDRHLHVVPEASNLDRDGSA